MIRVTTFTNKTFYIHFKPKKKALYTYIYIYLYFYISFIVKSFFFLVSKKHFYTAKAARELLCAMCAIKITKNSRNNRVRRV